MKGNASVEPKGAADSDLVRRWRIRQGREWDAEDHFIDSVEAWVFSRLTAPDRSAIRLLDAGCGSGERTRALSHLGYSAVGIDINVRSLLRDRSVREARLLAGDLHHLPFAAASFDALLSASVLQYGDWRRIVAEYARVLRPGGEALFIENLAGHPLARAYRTAHRLLGWSHPPHQTPREHFRWGDRRELSGFFSEIEFSAFHLTTPIYLSASVLRQRLLGRPWGARPGLPYRLLHRLDSCLLKAAPSLRRHCWLMVAYARR